MQACQCGYDLCPGAADCPARRLDRIVERKYQLLELLGVGGMAAVYEARHLRLGHKVAIKVVHRSLANRSAAGRRFFREAQSIAQIGHPGIVDVKDLGVDEEGCPWMEMERLQGHSIDFFLKDCQAMPIVLALYVARKALDALAAAHDHQVIHRDLKPNNLFLVESPRQRVVLLDFGVAKANDGYVLTARGECLGTYYYMSPEQLYNARTADIRSDIYSMGATLFDMLTGHPPVSGTDVATLSRRIFANEIERRPSAHNSGVEPWLDAVVEKALAFNPADRFQTAQEMTLALQRR
jgi:serine/threonine protein kinase